ncbi:MAG: hypothetical protein ACYSU0_18490 [Planctomycetota bacterium]|jgi:hypothetical protein
MTDDPVEQAREELRTMFKRYLAGQLAYGDLLVWAQDHPLFLKAQECASFGRKAEAEPVDHAFAIILTLDPDEPEEYRATEEDVIEVLEYLDGKKPYPGSGG